MNVNAATGDSVEQAVTRAVERQKSRIETDVHRKVEETITQQSGPAPGTGGGYRRPSWADSDAKTAEPGES